MLLVKKCQCFLYLVLVETTLEIRLNNVLDRKETFLGYKNKIFQSPKNRIFPKGLTHAFGKKMPILSFLVLVKTGVEIRVNNVLDRREFFFNYKNKIFQSPKTGIFPKGLTYAFGQKMPIFSLFVFA